MCVLLYELFVFFYIYFYSRNSPKKAVLARWQVFLHPYFFVLRFLFLFNSIKYISLMLSCFLSTPRSRPVSLPYLCFRGVSGFPPTITSLSHLSLRTFPTSEECLLSRALSTHGRALGAGMTMLPLENKEGENGDLVVPRWKKTAETEGETIVFWLGCRVYSFMSVFVCVHVYAFCYTRDLYCYSICNYIKFGYRRLLQALSYYLTHFISLGIIWYSSFYTLHFFLFFIEFYKPLVSAHALSRFCSCLMVCKPAFCFLGSNWYCFEGAQIA